MDWRHFLYARSIEAASWQTLKLMAAVALGWPAGFPEPRPRKSVDEVTEFLME